MNEEQKAFVLEKWLPALRSGNYRQGAGALRTKPWSKPSDAGSGYYCCLGVLCEAAGISWEHHGGSESLWPVGGDSPSILSKEIAELAGITPMGIFTPAYTWEEGGCEHQVMSLTGLNDHAGHSFEQIADFIEGAVSGTSGYKLMGSY